MGGDMMTMDHGVLFLFFAAACFNFSTPRSQHTPLARDSPPHRNSHAVARSRSSPTIAWPLLTPPATPSSPPSLLPRTLSPATPTASLTSQASREPKLCENLDLASLPLPVSFTRSDPRCISWGGNRGKVQQLMTITGASEKVSFSLQALKANDWHLEGACYFFFYSQPQISMTNSWCLEDLYNRYKEPDADMIMVEGIISTLQ